MISSEIIRQAAERRNAARVARAPDSWDVVLDCGHRHRFSDQQMHDPLQRGFNGNLYYCDKCANGDRTGTANDEGFCTKTIAHTVEMATPLFAGYSKQRQHQQQQQQQSQQSEEQELQT
jgi:hypothetical protein